jgi:murein DD-endopeptidase MepM/ murein hydrolase activator NlpD
MKKKLSIILISSSGAPAKQFTTSKALIGCVCLLLIASLVGIGIVVHDYGKLKKLSARYCKQQKDICLQEDIIENQRKQIQGFAEKIDDLKERLAGLNGFEKKIRIMANLEKSDDQNSLFGIGGPQAVDIDAKIPLQEKHNGLIREMHKRADQLKLASIDQKKEFEALIKNLEAQQNLLASTPAVRPANGFITSGFGYRKSPFTNLRELHKGIDFAAPKGTPIIATADGEVIFTGRKGWLGNTVIINHGHGIITKYGHTSKIFVKAGQSVKRGEKIAAIGNTGRSTGTHVHYEVHLNGIPVNPKRYIFN